MHYLLPTLLATTLCLATGAQAQTLVATSNIIIRALDRSLDFTSDTTTSIRDMKVVRAARDDAASFVASAGEIKALLRQHGIDDVQLVRLLDEYEHWLYAAEPPAARVQRRWLRQVRRAAARYRRSARQAV